jgi:hypothetical protein
MVSAFLCSGVIHGTDFNCYIINIFQKCRVFGSLRVVILKWPRDYYYNWQVIQTGPAVSGEQTNTLWSSGNKLL